MSNLDREQETCTRLIIGIIIIVLFLNITFGMLFTLVQYGLFRNTLCILFLGLNLAFFILLMIIFTRRLFGSMKVCLIENLFIAYSIELVILFPCRILLIQCGLSQNTSNILGWSVAFFILLMIIFTRRLFGRMKVRLIENPHTEKVEGFPGFLVYLIRWFFRSEEAIADLSALRCRLVSKKTVLWKRRAILLRASTSIVWGLTLAKIQNLLWFSRNRTRR
jgi:hypothetical protein